MKTRTQALAEIDLTGKHIAAWKSFIFSDAEYLVVLESDALIRNSKKFQMFLRSLDQFEKHDYISLTWPFSNELLGLSQTAPLKNKTYFTINFQLTNTCAGYILSKDLAQKLLEKAENGRVERKIAIDWFMNQMFAELRKREKWNMRTIVPNQELVINGSMVGEYVSGIQK
jgi:GR25 family glycosyltransferase involved in LPS biosynthesis